MILKPGGSSVVIMCCFSVEIQKDEIDALKAALQRTLQAKQDDLNLYSQTIDETKQVFLQALRQLKQSKLQTWWGVRGLPPWTWFRCVVLARRRCRWFCLWQGAVESLQNCSPEYFSKVVCSQVVFVTLLQHAVLPWYYCDPYHTTVYHSHTTLLCIHNVYIHGTILAVTVHMMC